MNHQCQDSERCAQIAARVAEWQARHLPEAQRLYTEFLRRYDEGTALLVFSDPHAARRQVQRSFNEEEMREVVEFGEVVDYTPQVRDLRYSSHCAIQLFGMAGARGRPLRVVCMLSREVPLAPAVWTWTVRTVWNPATRPWRWSDDFRRQVCWCQFEEESDEA